MMEWMVTLFALVRYLSFML